MSLIIRLSIAMVGIPIGLSLAATPDRLPVSINEVEAIEGQDLLARVVLDYQNDSAVRQRAIQKLTNQVLLAKIALHPNGDPNLPKGIAGAQLIDQTVLLRVATTDGSIYLRHAAAQRLEDPALRNHLTAANDLNLIVALPAIASLTNTTLLRTLAEGCLQGEHAGLAQVKLLLQEPPFNTKLRNTVVRPTYKVVSKNYTMKSIIPGVNRDEPINSGPTDLLGEDITVELRLEGYTQYKRHWSALLPSLESGQMSRREGTNAIQAKVDWKDFFAGLVNLPQFTTNDWTMMALSEVPDVRKAAFSRLTNETAIAEVALASPNRDVCNLAVDKITAQSILEKVALNATNYSSRGMAASKLTNQVTLANIALHDMDEWVQRSAVKRINDQSLLTRVALEATSAKTRAEAVFRLTDKETLQSIFAKDPDEFVRNVTKVRLKGLAK